MSLVGVVNISDLDREQKLCAGPVWDFNIAFGNANYLDGTATCNAVGDDGNHMVLGNRRVSEGLADL